MASAIDPPPSCSKLRPTMSVKMHKLRLIKVIYKCRNLYRSWSSDCPEFFLVNQIENYGNRIFKWETSPSADNSNLTYLLVRGKWSGGEGERSIFFLTFLVWFNLREEKGEKKYLFNYRSPLILGALEERGWDLKYFKYFVQ